MSDALVFAKYAMAREDSRSPFRAMERKHKRHDRTADSKCQWRTLGLDTYKSNNKHIQYLV